MAQTKSKQRRLSGKPTLSPHEQSELVLKLRYGIGLEQLGLPPLERVTPSRGPLPPPPPVAPREPDGGTHERAAALGITAGARGRWLSR